MLLQLHKTVTFTKVLREYSDWCYRQGESSHVLEWFVYVLAAGAQLGKTMLSLVPCLSGFSGFFISPCHDRWHSGVDTLHRAFSVRRETKQLKTLQLFGDGTTSESDMHTTFLALTTSWMYSSFSCSCLFCLPDRVDRVLPRK